MPRFKIHHVTRYSYETPVRDSANQIILFPVKDAYQDVLKQELQITGEPELDIYKDYYGNEVGLFMRTEPHQELIIDSRIEVITYSKTLPPDDLSLEDQWEQLRQLHQQVPYIDFLNQENFDGLSEMLEEVNRQGAHEHTPLQLSKNLTDYVYSNFQYIKDLTTVETTTDEIWKLKAGVCQDFAHILLLMLRFSGVPARYVSGYICPNKNGMRGEGATHAWVEACIPSYGWMGFDPTNNCIVNELHVRLAVGRNFTDCSPVKGTYKGVSQHRLEVGVSVSYENGRITDEIGTSLVQHPVKNPNQENSYRKYIEMLQQQQQQQ
jgi:transglutaminase-like putative cysteine protease